MSPEDRLAFIERFFRLVCAMDAIDSFFFTTNGSVFFTGGVEKGLSIYANCNDLFEWACADAEEITPDNINVLEQAWADVKPLRDAWYTDTTKTIPYVSGGHAVELFAARVRKMRPQGPCYSSFPPEIAKLFDAAGPDRGAKREYKEGVHERHTPDNARPWTCPKCRGTN